MARYHHNVYASARTPRYVVVFDLQWQILECRRLEPGSDLRCAMGATIDRLAKEGWRSENTPEFGFVFLSCNSTRRLLVLTERDPYETTLQSFSPFK